MSVRQCSGAANWNNGTKSQTGLSKHTVSGSQICFSICDLENSVCVGTNRNVILLR